MQYFATFVRAGLALCLGYALATASYAGAATPPALFGDSWDGLEARDRAPLTRLQVRPDVNFRAYRRVRLDPVHIALERDWDPTLSERLPHQQLAPADLVALRGVLAHQLRRRVEAALANARYELVAEDAPDVLRLSVAVLDLDAHAPDERRSGTEPMYVLDAERVVLTLELRDSVTGQLLARVIDMKQGGNTQPWTFTGSPSDSPPVAAALDKWAAGLRAGLDRAFGKG